MIICECLQLVEPPIYSTQLCCHISLSVQYMLLYLIRLLFHVFHQLVIFSCRANSVQGEAPKERSDLSTTTKTAAQATPVPVLGALGADSEKK